MMRRDKVGRGRVRLLSGILLLTLAVSALGMVEGQGVEAVAQRSAAVTILVRASQAVLAAPNAVLSFLEYDDSAEAGRQAPILFLDATREPKRALDEAMLLAPDKPAQIEGFRTRFEDLLEKVPAPLAVGGATPDLTRGSDLTATDLAELASGARLAVETDVQLQSPAGSIGFRPSLLR
jgi:hypothetical protein